MDDSSFKDNRPSKAKIVWIVLLTIILIASNTAWGLFYFQQQGNTNAKISKLSVEKEVLEEELADAKKSASKNDDDIEYREIQELGVKYKLDDETKDLTYAYHGNKEDGGMISWSTISISKKSEGDKSCNSYDGFMVGWNTATDVYSTKKKKVGSLTVYSAVPDGGDRRPEACKDAELNEKLKTAEKRAFDSLQPID